MIDPHYQRLIIADERDTINHYAREIGFFKGLLEDSKNEILSQWYVFYITLAEAEMENAHERLKKLRNELTDHERGQVELCRI